MLYCFGMTAFLLFDDRLDDLSPLSDLRPSWEVRTGALTSRARMEIQLGRRFDGCCVMRDLHAMLEGDASLRTETPPGIYINGRCVMLPPGVQTLAEGHLLIDPATGMILAAHLDKQAAAALLRGDTPSGRASVADGSRVMSRPWHVRTHRDACLGFDLDWFSAQLPVANRPAGVVAFGLSPFHAAESAQIYPGSMFDLEHGPIVLDEFAVVRPGAQLIGPCYVGPHSTVLERATIRPGTAIGPWCKVNGETGGTIFQGYSNKAHDGYVGDSWLGEWVNLGAGTTTSNLLNTYGEIIAKRKPDASNERTGQQFLGSIIGDHTKTAICTRLMTGTVIHAGSMIATTAPASGCIPAFAWCTDAGTRSYRLDKFLEVMTAAMGRRKVSPSTAYVARITRLHELEMARARAANVTKTEERA